MVEIRFVPQDKQVLDTMFKAMSECQLLHPDPVDQCSPDEDDDEDEDEDEDEGVAEQAQLETEGNIIEYANGSNGQSKNLPAGDQEPMDE